MAEAYNLFLGTTILKQMRIHNPMILGDSTIVIATMASGGELKKVALNNLKLRIMDNIRHLGDTTFKHVLRDNNTEADSFATRATNRPTGQARENDTTYDNPIS